MSKKQTWWVTLANGVCLPQPCVPVAGQVASNHLAFGQKGDDNGSGDGCDQYGHQELPVVRGVFAFLACQSVCKRGKWITFFLNDGG